MGTLAELIALAEEIPESHLSAALERLRKSKEKTDTENESAAETSCPHCGSKKVVRNGHKHRKPGEVSSHKKSLEA